MHQRERWNMHDNIYWTKIALQHALSHALEQALEDSAEHALQHLLEHALEHHEIYKGPSTLLTQRWNARGR